MNNEQWKDEILKSMRGAKRAEPNPFLFTRIQSKLAEEIIPSSGFWKIATVLSLFLLTLNISLIMQDQRATRESANRNSSYLSETFTYQLY